MMRGVRTGLRIGPAGLRQPAAGAVAVLARRGIITEASRTIDLGEDQLAFQEMADQFGQDQLAPHAEEWDKNKIFPKDVLREAAALGFGGIFIDPEHGGTGLKRLDGVVIFEALARGCTSTTSYLTIHNMCGWMIDTFGNNEQKARWLPDLCTMDKFTSYCLTEPNSGSDAGSLRTTAVRDGDDFILNGSKAFISGASQTDLLLVMARTGTQEDGPSGVTCFAVDADTPGLSYGAQERKMGWNSQPTAAVILDNCRVPAANMLGGEGQGFKLAMAGLDGGRLSIGSCSIGAAQASFDMAREHLGDRKQFGRALSTNQALQFKLADMQAQLHVGRSIVRQAARAMDDANPDKTALCAMAKRVATDAGFQVCNEALQLFGGYGYLADYGVERNLRDVRVMQILEGTNEIMRVILARDILSANQ